MHSAKTYLDSIELGKTLPALTIKETFAQSKMTLKWTVDGDLSAVDMARTLQRFSDPELTQCGVACDLEDQKNSFEEYLSPTTWLP